MSALLQTKGLWKDFNGTSILKGIDLSVDRGEFVAVMGPSGSGKSTLLYNISGMDRATKGELRFAGEELESLDDEKMSKIRLKRMGFIFQHAHLLKTLSIRDNIVLPGFKAKLDRGDRVYAYAIELMTRTGIEHIAEHDIKKVSGGQLQRAAICRALINHPEILFGDEPTGALNSGSSREVMDILNEINAQGTTVMLVTHDAKVAARADRVIFLSDGMITDEIFLGKYKQNDSAKREKAMAEWLDKHRF